MKRTNDKSEFAVLEFDPTTEVDVRATFVDTDTGKEYDCKILQIEYMGYSKDEERELLLVEYLPDEIIERRQTQY
jgi:hypothetical protein